MKVKYYAFEWKSFAGNWYRSVDRYTTAKEASLAMAAFAEFNLDNDRFVEVRLALEWSKEHA